MRIQQIIEMIPKPDEERAKGKAVIPVIDRRYPLSEVPEALQYVVEGRAKGKGVITVE